MSIPITTVPKNVKAIEIPNSNFEKVFSSLEASTASAVRTRGRFDWLVSNEALQVEPDSVWTHSSFAEITIAL